MTNVAEREVVVKEMLFYVKCQAVDANEEKLVSFLDYNEFSIRSYTSIPYL